MKQEDKLNSFTPDRASDQTFIPARPIPKPSLPTMFEIAVEFRQDMLTIWWEHAYINKSMATKVLGRNIIIANSPESVKYVLMTNNDNYERKSPQMRRALEYLLGDGLFISDGDTWKFRRQMIAPIIHKNRLPNFAPLMVEAAGELADRWQMQGEDVEVNMLVEMASLTSEIIARTVFGRDLGRAHALDVIEGFTRYQALVDQFNIGYFLGLDDGMPMFKGPRIRKATKMVHNVVDGIIAEHLEGRGDDSSMITMLLNSVDADIKQKLTPVALRNEALTIFMAGHETTAATLAWAWYLLSQYPWVEQKLHQELDQLLEGRAPTLADVSKLNFTRAVIEETLRLYPPVPVLSRQARDEDEIAGHRVKKADLVLVIPWLLHRHRRYWQAPDHFHPERFLQAKRPAPYSYIPFSIGPRICSGAAFGLTETILCLAALAQKFQPRLVPGWEVETSCRLTLRPKGGLPMHLKLRTS
jgi:cytochrome P450